MIVGWPLIPKELSWVVWDEWKDSKQRMWALDWNNHWKTLIKSVPLTWLNNFPDVHWWKLTHTYTTDQRLFCSCADQYWRFCASVPPWVPLHIPDWIPALLLPVGRTDRRAHSGLAQFLSLCIAATAEAELHRGEGSKIFTDLHRNTLIQKIPLQYSVIFSTF